MESGLKAIPLAVGAHAAYATIVYANHLKPCVGVLEDRKRFIKLD